MPKNNNQHLWLLLIWSGQLCCCHWATSIMTRSNCCFVACNTKKWKNKRNNFVSKKFKIKNNNNQPPPKTKNSNQWFRSLSRVTNFVAMTQRTLTLTCQSNLVMWSICDWGMQQCQEKRNNFVSKKFKMQNNSSQPKCHRRCKNKKQQSMTYNFHWSGVTNLAPANNSLHQWSNLPWHAMPRIKRTKETTLLVKNS